MSNLRSLAPSNQNDHSSGSSSMKGNLAEDLASGYGNSGGTSSGGASGGAGGGGGFGGGDAQRKRRNAGNVSLMACTDCRHARQRVCGMVLSLVRSFDSTISPSSTLPAKLPRPQQTLITCLLFLIIV